VRPGLRLWDQRAARGADLYVANSAVVRRRIASVYGIEAQVVHPPVDIDRFYPSGRGERLLVVSRLLPYKRVDVIVRAATSAGIGLDVVGSGPELERLRALAGPTVEFHGTIPDNEVTQLMEDCRALCVAGREDFGMTPVEAQAAGKPVIAFASGGALETIADGVTGVLFSEPSPEAVLRALDEADRLDTAPESIAAHVARFAPEAFAERFCSVIAEALAERETVERRAPWRVSLRGSSAMAR
jgi:glycosyltransferase involved in cell wall biosynthesis